MAPVEIISRPATGKDRQAFDVDFCNLPERVRRDPYRAGLLSASIWQEFLHMSSMLKSRFWVARVRGESVARVGANISAANAAIGGIGFFEADPAHEEAGRALLREAAAWLKEQGASEAYGPLNFNTWFAYRYRVSPNDERHHVWEPVNPPEYPLWFRAEGFRDAELYHTVCLSGMHSFIDRTQSGYEQATKHGYTLRPFRMQDFLGEEVPALYRISMEVFRENLLFEPISFDMFRSLYVPVAKKLDFSLSRFAVNPAGKEVGFFFNFRDGDAIVMKTAAVLPECRGLGISNAIAHVSAIAARDEGLTHIITALVRKGIQSESFNRKSPALWEHDYVLFKKELS